MVRAEYFTHCFGMPKDDGEHIVEIVRHTTDECAEGLHFACLLYPALALG